MKIKALVSLNVVLAITLFSSIVFSAITAKIGSSSGYDPWLDTDDDGDIDFDDIVAMAMIYGTSGTPINKTELLLELEARIDSLNTTLLTEYYNITECDVIFVDASGDTITGNLDVAWDIQCETLEVDGDRVYLGSTEGNQIIFFYDNAIPTGEYIYWADSQDRFTVSDDINIQGTINIPTTTRYYSIPACAWQPALSTSDFGHVGYFLYTMTPGSTSWYAPVNLPHGAVVTELGAWLWDYATYEDIDVYLYRQPPGAYLDRMARVSSSGSHGFYQQSTSSIDYATVDNQYYSYYLTATLRSGDSSHRLSNVHITYTIDEPLP